MGFDPTDTEKRARARADMRMGVPVVVGGADGGVVLAAETIDSDRLTAVTDLPSPVGQASLAITDWRARTLNLAAYDGDLVRVCLPQDASPRWVHALANPVDDLKHPMKGPLTALRDGNASLARNAIDLCKGARLLPAAVIVPLYDPAAFAQMHDLTMIAPRPTQDAPAIAMTNVISARLPLSVSEAGRLHVFRPDDGSEEHYAVEIGQPDRAAPILARLHSACFTGDLLGSLKCDCGPQLHAALAQMGAQGAGVLLYLNQEGRGIGLANKMRAYALQDQGFDTVEANHRLGFADDERDFRIGADILKQMGFSAVHLLTNNPAKIAKMEACGVTVAKRVPLQVGQNPHNHDYLATKATKSGHML